LKGKITIVRAGGDIERREVTASVPLDDLQKAVGGYIETVPYFETFEGNRCVAFRNEEGKLQGLPVNETMTRLWYEAVPGMAGQDVLVGDIIVLQGDDAFMPRI
jgi:hypothetical protein